MNSRAHRRGTLRRARGFSLIEVAVVMVIIAVIYGAVISGADVIRVARGQRLLTDFVFAWNDAFHRHVKQTGHVPGDNGITKVNLILSPGGGRLLCNNPGAPELSNTFLANHVEIPEGVAPGEEAQSVYQDSRGTPHVLRACMLTAAWSVPGTAVGSYQVIDRHVLRLQGLTTELAAQFDTTVDNRADARFGRFRIRDLAANTGATGADWPPASSDAEGWVPEVEAYLDMTGH